MLCLWVGIGGIGALAWVGAHLPPIQSLAIPERPPAIKIEDIHGRVLATRGDAAGEVLVAERTAVDRSSGLRRHRGSALLPKFGVDPLGIARARRSPTFCISGVAQGSSSSYPATRQKSLLRLERTVHSQAAGGDPGDVAGGQILQGANPRAVSESGLSRRRRLRHRGGRAAISTPPPPS